MISFDWYLVIISGCQLTLFTTKRSDFTHSNPASWHFQLCNSSHHLSQNLRITGYYLRQSCFLKYGEWRQKSIHCPGIQLSTKPLNNLSMHYGMIQDNRRTLMERQKEIFNSGIHWWRFKSNCATFISNIPDAKSNPGIILDHGSIF